MLSSLLKVLHEIFAMLRFLFCDAFYKEEKGIKQDDESDMRVMFYSEEEKLSVN